MSKLSDVLKSKGKESVDDYEERVIDLICETRYSDDDCELCNGLGSVIRFIVTGGPVRTPSKIGDKWLEIDGKEGWYHGRLETEPCPGCQERDRIDHLKEKSGLTPDEFDVRLTEFKTVGIFKDKKDAWETVAKWAGQGQNLNGFATLHGSYGVGKSMLGKCLVGELIRNSCAAHYVIASEMVNEIRSNFAEGSGSLFMVEEAIRRWKNYRVLIIDEFDKLSFKTEWTKELVHRLINARYEGRKEKFTMMITNTAPNDLPEDFGYIASRMHAGNIIHVQGIDVRPGAK